MTQKIVIPHLLIGGQKIETPIGLSELLEQTWVKQKKVDEIAEFVSEYDRIVYRNSEGSWVTRYEKKEVELNANDEQRMASIAKTN